MNKYFVILAAGIGSRFGYKIPKQYSYIGGKYVLKYSIDKAIESNIFKKIIVVINKSHKRYFRKIKNRKITFIKGGKTRQDSSFIALKFLKKFKPNYVYIHDAARPFFSLKLLKSIDKALKNNEAIAPVIKIDSSLKIKKKNKFFNFDRNKALLTQTPQAFKYINLFNLFKKNKTNISDEVSLYLNNHKKIKFIKGEKNNIKITEKSDLTEKNFKTNYGIGFDVHRLVPGRKMYLGGLKIKSKIGTLGHSDGDPVLHAITDSLLGASKQGDIGEKFSDKSKKFKNIRSTILLKKVISQIEDKGYLINNIDINIITQTPKIKKYKVKIANLISKLCNISTNQINIKGKTTEKLGLIGREKAIACEVISSLTKHD